MKLAPRPYFKGYPSKSLLKICSQYSMLNKGLSYNSPRFTFMNQMYGIVTTTIVALTLVLLVLPILSYSETDCKCVAFT
ncbi:MAG TPA: hypothetical protein VJS91_07525, partial [Nitrososphaeraceae archaeon]|nr:hypothetical protein [Nitrososphaeraceae archaeon]